MITALLIIIAATLLFGAAAVLGVLGAVFWAAILTAVITVVVVFFGLSAQSILLSFICFLALLLILHWMPIALEPPRWIKFTKKQREFLKNIDEYHRIKDRLHARKNELAYERAKGESADKPTIGLLNAEIENLEIQIARFD